VYFHIFEGNFSFSRVSDYIYFHASGLEIARVYAKVTEKLAFLAFDSKFRVAENHIIVIVTDDSLVGLHWLKNLLFC
jgi:hypothetical protein